MKVSILMPAFNAANFIEESILSIQNQTFKDWELIVVDDGSTDETADIVKRLQKLDARIVYIYQKNKRLGAARNTGFRNAKGQYIAFLDSDDLWFPKKLELQLDAITETGVDLVFTDGYILEHETKNLIDYPTVPGYYSGIDAYKSLFFSNYVPVLSVLMKASWIEKVGYQGENIQIFGCEDWDYWLRMLRFGAKFFGMPEKLFKYRVHNKCMSRNLAIMKHAEFIAISNNIEYQFLSKKEVFKRHFDLLNENLPRLLENKNYTYALEEIQLLLRYNFKVRFLLLYLFVCLRLSNLNKKLRYFYYPGSFLIKLKLIF